MSFLTKLLKLNNLNVSLTQFRSLQTQKVSNILPVFTQITNISNPWIYQQNDHVKFPVSRIHKIELPNGLKWVLPLTDPTANEISIESPSSNISNTPLSAIGTRIGITVIRRKKMKKHKLKKLRKRMKFEWAKKRQRRELRKEKLFQAKLIQQCKEAELFSAEKYVQDKIDKWKELTQGETQKRHEFVNGEKKY